MMPPGRNYADGSYEGLAFDQVSGWSEWLQTNKQEPTGNPCFDTGHEGDGGKDE